MSTPKKTRISINFLHNLKWTTIHFFIPKKKISSFSYRTGSYFSRLLTKLRFGPDVFF